MDSDIVGIDPSLTSTGIAVLHRESFLSVPREQTFTRGDKGKADATWPQREARITDLAYQVAMAVPTDARVFMEGPAYSKAQGSSHDRAGYWWKLYTALLKRGAIITVVMPNLRAKYATGTNGAKDAVMAAAIRRYPQFEINGNDVADAVVLLAMGCRLLGEPLEVGMPKANLDALKTLML